MIGYDRKTMNRHQWIRWLTWIGASTISGSVGVVAGGYCSLFIGYLIGDPNGQTDNFFDLVLIVFIAAIGGTIGSLAGGFMHWVLMRRYLRDIQSWLFRCAIWGLIAWLPVLGITIGGLMLRLWNPFDYFTVTLAVVGALLGTLSVFILGDRPSIVHHEIN